MFEQHKDLHSSGLRPPGMSQVICTAHLITVIWLHMCPIYSFCPSYCTTTRWICHKTTSACLHSMCYAYLLRGTEDVSVVLAEPANTGETSKRSGELITMQGPEIGPSQGKLPPRANSLLKHETKHEKGELDTDSSL